MQLNLHNICIFLWRRSLTFRRVGVDNEQSGGGGHICYDFVIFDDCANRPGGGTFQLRSIGALAANIYRQVLHSIF